MKNFWNEKLYNSYRDEEIKTPEVSYMRINVILDYIKKKGVDDEVCQGLTEMLTHVEKDYRALMNMARKERLVLSLPVMLTPSEITPESLRSAWWKQAAPPSVQSLAGPNHKLK